jgi:hypothetical protein
VWSLQERSGGVRWCAGKVRVSVGWRPVGWLNEVLYVRGWSLGCAVGFSEA